MAQDRSGSLFVCIEALDALVGRIALPAERSEASFARSCLGSQRLSFARSWADWRPEAVRTLYAALPREDGPFRAKADAQIALMGAYRAALPDGRVSLMGNEDERDATIADADASNHALALLFLDHGAHGGLEAYRASLAEVLYQHLVLRCDSLNSARAFIRRGAAIDEKTRLYINDEVSTEKWRLLDKNHRLADDVADAVQAMINGGAPASSLPAMRRHKAAYPISIPAPFGTGKNGGPDGRAVMFPLHLDALRDAQGRRIDWLWEYPVGRAKPHDRKRTLLGSTPNDTASWRNAGMLLAEWVWSPAMRRDRASLELVDHAIDRIAQDVTARDPLASQDLLNVRATLYDARGKDAPESDAQLRERYLAPLFSAVLASVAHGPGSLQRLDLYTNLGQEHKDTEPVPAGAPRHRADVRTTLSDQRGCLLVTAGKGAPLSAGSVVCATLPLDEGTYIFGRSPSYVASSRDVANEVACGPVRLMKLDVPDASISRRALALVVEQGGVAAYACGSGKAFLHRDGALIHEPMVCAARYDLACGDTVTLVGAKTDTHLTYTRTFTAPALHFEEQ